MNQWNQLVDIFGCTGTGEEVPECAADNICIAWPALFKGIERCLGRDRRLDVLDFGCGGGLLCKRLFEMGHAVTGYDQSEELVASARTNVPPEVIITNTSADLARHGPYDLITSVMVLQFIDEVEPVIEQLLSLLKPAGLMLYAVFNPQFVEENLGQGVFAGRAGDSRCSMELKAGVGIPFYNRSALEYRQLFEKKGCAEVYRDLPPFTEEFLSRYRMPFATDQPEYLIQGFRRVEAEQRGRSGRAPLS